MQSIPKMQEVGGVRGGVTYLRQCFFRKSMQSLSRLGASLYGVQ